MPSPDDRIVRAFLKRSMVAQLATRSAKGHPFMTPLWFVVHGGILYMTTGPGSWAGKNVVRNPEVVLLLSGERGRRSRRVLRLRGTGSCHLGLPSWPVLLRIAAKYYAAPGALPLELRNVGKWHLRRRYYGQLAGGFGHLRVVPSSADFLPIPGPL